jgi:Ca2+-binding EF-hand superfamily protein
MIHHLEAVYKVMYHADSNIQEKIGMTPRELAEQTTSEAFAMSDLNNDETLSFEEFRNWMLEGFKGGTSSNIVSGAQKEATSKMTLGEVRRLTGLENYPLDTIVKMFKSNYMDEDEDMISRESLIEFFTDLVERRNPTNEERERVKVMLGGLYELFDTDDDGTVSASELVAGISVLCGGSRDRKAERVFNMFDIDGSNSISFEEFCRMLFATFKVIYAAEPDTEKEMGCSALDLAIVTAESAFEDADLNHDGELSLEEFRRWYGSDSSVAVSNIIDQGSSKLTLDETRRVSRLDRFTFTEIKEVFKAGCNSDGTISREAFVDCFAEIAGAVIGDGEIDLDDEDEFRVLVSNLYNVFDTDRNGVLDIREILSGLSVLCATLPNEEDKINSTFKMYDANNDGTISQSELIAHMHAVFKLMCETSEGQESTEFTPLELATATAKSVFEEADVDKDEKLTLEEFQEWASKPDSSAQKIDTLRDTAVRRMDMNMLRSLTHLNAYPIKIAFTAFANYSDEHGLITRSNFMKCLMKLAEISQEDNETLTVAISALYDIFDTDSNGVVDLNELSSGLGLLCNGTPEEKGSASFELYDVNGTNLLLTSKLSLSLSLSHTHTHIHIYTYTRSTHWTHTPHTHTHTQVMELLLMMKWWHYLHPHLKY